MNENGDIDGNVKRPFSVSVEEVMGYLGYEVRFVGLEGPLYHWSGSSVEEAYLQQRWVIFDGPESIFVFRNASVEDVLDSMQDYVSPSQIRLAEAWLHARMQAGL